MLTTKSYSIKDIETGSPLLCSHCHPQSSLILSTTLSSVIDKVESTHTSRFKSITKAIKSTTTSIFRRLIKTITRSDSASHAESSQLIGITIHPQIAIKYQNKIDFNGTGEIKSLKTNNINKKDYYVLINNRIRSLNESPHIVKERIRTPGEAVVDIAGVLKKTSENLVNKHELEEIIKSTWLDGSLSRQSLYNMAELIKIKTHDHPKIINDIDAILQSLEQSFFITKRNDNYYGRLFETELSQFIIDHPNMDMLKVRNIISSFILDDFQKLSKQEQLALSICLADRMYADPPAWRAQLSCANKFIKNNNPESFIKMMRHSGEYSVPLVLSTAVKYIISAQSTIELKNEATEYYINKILPQRQIFSSLKDKKGTRSSAYGLLLPYQKNHLLNHERPLGIGIRPIDKYMRPTVGVELPEHDAVALRNERTIGIGVSGSSNILNFLFRKLQLQDESFPVDDAKLATASWLSYSGGHSFNEAYSVFGFMSQGNFKPLSFNELKTSSALSDMAIAHAYNKVVETSVALSG